MDTKTLKALQLSIDHWARLATGTYTQGYEHVGSKCCALCTAFFHTGSEMCEGCPVRDKTGKSVCVDSPYSTAARTADIHGLDSLSFRAAARDELKFLKSLLPINEKALKIPVNEKALKIPDALEDSIEHWGRFVTNTPNEGEYIGYRDCPLCQLFHPVFVKENGEEQESDCDGCPIKEDTGASYCASTPYNKVFNLSEREEDFREEALKMLIYLESLRDKSKMK